LLALARGHPRKPSFEDPFGTGKPADEKQEPRIEVAAVERLCSVTCVLAWWRDCFFHIRGGCAPTFPNSNYVSSIWLFGVRLQH
jgi:hypothetical protein